MPPRQRSSKPAPRKRANPALIADEQVAALDLKRKGWSYVKIGVALGFSATTAHDRVKAAIAEIVIPVAEDVRKLELERLDGWLVRLESRMDAGEDPVKVVPVAVRVSERRCRLLGVDAPERIDVTSTELSAVDVELRELLAEVEASNAVTEQQLGRSS